MQTQSAILSKQVVQLILPLFPRKYIARIRSPGNFWAKVDKVSKMPTEATRGTKKKCLLVWPPRIHSGFFLYFLGLQERHDYISPMLGQAVLVCSFQYINTKAKWPMFIFYGYRLRFSKPSGATPHPLWVLFAFFFFFFVIFCWIGAQCLSPWLQDQIFKALRANISSSIFRFASFLFLIFCCIRTQSTPW